MVRNWHVRRMPSVTVQTRAEGLSQGHGEAQAVSYAGGKISYMESASASRDMKASGRRWREEEAGRTLAPARPATTMLR